MERSRVLQDALHVLAQDNHNLEQRVAGISPRKQGSPGNSADNNSTVLYSPSHVTDMDQSDEDVDDMFYDCHSVNIENGRVN